MKNITFLLCIYFSTTGIYASVTCTHVINVNSNFSIYLQFTESEEFELTAGLYFDLLQWSKNSQVELANINGSLSFYQINRYNSSVIFTQNGSVEAAYHFWHDVRNDRMEIKRYLIIRPYFDDRGGNVLEEEFFWDRNEGLIKPIVAKINTIYEIDTQYDNVNTIELFVKNNSNNIARNQFQPELIRSNFIYINREELMKNIGKDNDYFIETIIVNRNEISSIIGTARCDH